MKAPGFYRLAVAAGLLAVALSTGCATSAQVQRLSKLGLAVTGELAKELKNRQAAVEKVPDLADLISPLRATPPASKGLEAQVAAIGKQLELRGKVLQALTRCYAQLLQFVAGADEQPIASALGGLGEATDSYAAAVGAQAGSAPGGLAGLLSGALGARALRVSSQIIRARLEQLNEAMKKEAAANQLFEVMQLDLAFRNAQFLLEKQVATGSDALQDQLAPFGLKIDDDNMRDQLKASLEKDSRLAERQPQIIEQLLRRRLERLKEARTKQLATQLAALHVLIEQHKRFEAGHKIDLVAAQALLGTAPDDN